MTPLGDAALMIHVGSAIDEPTRLRVAAVARAVRNGALDGVSDVVPGFTTVTVHYDPVAVSSVRGRQASPESLVRHALEMLLANLASISSDSARRVEIPVCYDPEFAPDLELVARHTGLAPGEVVERHTARDYRVHLLGFLPGFAYLGGMDPDIATPRRETPRTVVPAGAVGIGGLQTGVYPVESPGGWQLIGRSPVILFDPERNPPTALAAGDIVQFRAIDRSEYDGLLGTPP